MKKHYAFVPLKEKDLSSFRKSLISNLVPRPVCAVITLAALGLLGFFKQDILIASYPALLLFSLAAAVVVYLLFIELQKLFVASRIHKSSLLPFIHVRGLDSSFYAEEVTNGFIVQVAPVNRVDITDSKSLLAALAMRFSEGERLFTHLLDGINSDDPQQVNKAVIYVEIINDQIEKGNKDILATYDKLENFKEDLC